MLCVNFKTTAQLDFHIYNNKDTPERATNLTLIKLKTAIFMVCFWEDKTLFIQRGRERWNISEKHHISLKCRKSRKASYQKTIISAALMIMKTNPKSYNSIPLWTLARTNLCTLAYCQMRGSFSMMILC